MLKKLFSTPDINDICPNCGISCSATDVLCPNCGENLDELFEKLPQYEQTSDVFRTASQKLAFLNWLTPLFLVLSPLVVSLATVLPVVLSMPITPGRGPFQLIWHAVPPATLSSSGQLLVTAIPLFLCTTASLRTKIRQRVAVLIATLFSIMSGIALWSGLQTVNMMTTYRAFGFFGIILFIGYPAQWVYIVIGIGMVLIALDLMVIIGQGKTAYREKKSRAWQRHRGFFFIPPDRREGFSACVDLSVLRVYNLFVRF
jgi:hypothetical protein